MAVAQQVLDDASATLLDTLSKTPTQQLAILVTQHASLPKHTTRALQTLAAHAVRRTRPLQRGTTECMQAQHLLDVLRRLIQRGDPSQARLLVPTLAAMIDLALCIDARDVLARLMDRTSVDEVIRAAIMSFEKAKGQGGQQIARAAFVLARVLFSLPKYEQGSNHFAQRKLGGQKSQHVGVLGASNTIKLIKSLANAYSQITATADDYINLTAKICFLDAAWSLFDRFFAVNATTSAAVVDEILGAADSQASGNTPLVDLPLLLDVASVRPLVALVRPLAPQSSVVDGLARRTEQIRAGSGGHVSFDHLGPGWNFVASRFAEQEPATVSTHRSVHVDEGLLESIFAILPHWQDRKARLMEKLSEAPYAGQNNDMVVQMLMDDNDDAPPTTSQTAPPEVDPLEIVRQRANIFNDVPVGTPALVPHRKGKGRATEKDIMGSGLSNEIKASIIARAEAPDSDEEDRMEWDPFAEDEAPNVGFEEELNDEHDGFTEKARFSRRDHGADADDDSDDEEESTSTTVSGGAQKVGKTDRDVAKAQVSDRTAERILITAWKENGGEVFKREARKTNARSSLLSTLQANSNSKHWDDQLVESWGTMFERNPKKEKLLAAASDILRAGNPNRSTYDGGENEGESDSSIRGFGVNRGRGGRVLTGESTGGGSRGGRGRGGRGGRGQHRGRGNRGSASAPASRGSLSRS